MGPSSAAGRPATAEPGAVPPLAGPWRRTLAETWRRAVRGTWRVAVAEDSMRPAIEPGDWLLLDPTVLGWPRRGAVVVVREPETEVLAIKRVAARPGDHVRIPEGLLHLGPDQAWLLGDAASGSIDSRRYGPLELDRLVGRAWLRYWPPGRLGAIGRTGTTGRIGRRGPWRRTVADQPSEPASGSR